MHKKLEILSNKKDE